MESDSLDIVLCLRDENLIFSEILDWKLPSLSNRYLEACSELKCGKISLWHMARLEEKLIVENNFGVDRS